MSKVKNKLHQVTQKSMTIGAGYKVKKVDAKKWKEKYLQTKEQFELNQALEFMGNMVANIEVVKEDKILKSYFIIPFVGHFLTNNIKKHITYETNRNSGKERIQFLVENTQKYQ